MSWLRELLEELGIKTLSSPKAVSKKLEERFGGRWKYDSCRNEWYQVKGAGVVKRVVSGKRSQARYFVQDRSATPAWVEISEMRETV